MPRNKLKDLNNHLFAALERLDDEELTPEQLALEIQKAKAVTKIAKAVIDTAKVAIEGAKLVGSGEVPMQLIPDHLKESNLKSIES